MLANSFLISAEMGHAVSPQSTTCNVVALLIVMLIDLGFLDQPQLCRQI